MATTEAGRLRRAQLTELARLQPMNTAVSMLVATLTALVLWPAVSRLAVTVWWGLHMAAAVITFQRWWHHRHVARSQTASRRGPRKAVASALVAGMMWSSLIFFWVQVDGQRQLTLALAVFGMVAGASATLAAVPAAARAFIVAALLPFGFYFAAQATWEHGVLAAFALVMALALIQLSQNTHRAFVQSHQAQQENARLVQQLEHDRREWMEIAETSEAFAIFDSDGCLRFWNANLAGYLDLEPQSLVPGSPMEALYSRASLPEGLSGDSLSGWLDSLDAQGYRTEKHRNGRWLRSTRRGLSNGDQIVVHVDVTDLVQAEEAARAHEAKLSEVQRMETVGRLSGGVAHDFNNLLTVIRGQTGLLNRQVRDERIGDIVARIDAAASKAAEMTRQLLAIGRKQSLQIEPMDLNSELARLRPVLESVLSESVTCSLQLDPDPLWVDADRRQLERVVFNLVLNARDASSAGDTITIQTWRDGAEVACEVRDTGRGMTDEVAARAFDPFFTTKPEGAGSGLGLSSAYGVIKQSGGDLVIHSREGQGTRVRFRLPSVVAPDKAFATVDEPPAFTGDAEGDSMPAARVLVVDDSVEVRLTVEDSLRALGYEVVGAASAGEALNCLSGGQVFDLVVSDVVMPGMTGPELVERLRREGEHLPVILVSGYSADALGDGIERLEDCRLLPKPFTLERLAGAVSAALTSECALETRREPSRKV